MKRGTLKTVAVVMSGTLLMIARTWAVDFHVASAQDLQNALTMAAGNGADNVIYLAAGYYAGNFNYNTTQPTSLTIQNEADATNINAIVIDGAGTGRDMNLASSGNAAITVRGVTFLRNCGDASKAALRVATGTGTGADVLVEDCRFLSPSGTSGAGLELGTGRNATVRGCSVAGRESGGGQGISISNFTGNVLVQTCMVTTNRFQTRTHPETSFCRAVILSAAKNLCCFFRLHQRLRPFALLRVTRLRSFRMSFSQWQDIFGDETTVSRVALHNSHVSEISTHDICTSRDICNGTKSPAKDRS